MARREGYNKEYYLKNRDKLLQASKDWRLKNPDRIGFKLQSIKERHYRVNYGITYEDYLKMLEEQNNVCAICEQPETHISHRSNKLARLAVDHCHVTNKVRGLLCTRCNKSIGQFEDKIELLESAIKYLKGE